MDFAKLRTLRDDLEVEYNLATFGVDGEEFQESICHQLFKRLPSLRF